MFYLFDQNNSGGSFDPPAQNLYIEADSIIEAIKIAQSEYGVYFDGVDKGFDCTCCGDRWYKPRHDVTEKFASVKPASLVEKFSKEDLQNFYPLNKCMVRYSDGREEYFHIDVSF